MVLVEEGQYHDRDQDASFPDPDHSDSTLWIRDWTLLKKEINKLEVFQIQCLLGVTRLDRLRNETVRRQCGDQSTIEEVIQKRHLQWFGHVWHRQPPTWRVHRWRPGQNNLKRRRLTLVDAMTLSIDRSAWKQIVKDAPTAAYELQRRLQHNAS